MSSMIGHARAAHILAECFVAQAFAAEGDHVELLAHFGNAYEMAANRMDAEMRAESEQSQAQVACTLPHGKDQCPVCKERS